MLWDDIESGQKGYVTFGEEWYPTFIDRVMRSDDGSYVWFMVQDPRALDGNLYRYFFPQPGTEEFDQDGLTIRINGNWRYWGVFPSDVPEVRTENSARQSWYFLFLQDFPYFPNGIPSTTPEIHDPKQPFKVR